MSEATYPRLVVVSAEPMGAPSGTGITLDNLFSLWPQSRLLQVHTSVAPSDVAANSFHWDESLVHGAQLLRRRAGRRTSLPPSRPAMADVAARAADTRPAWQRAWMDQLPLKRSRELDQLLEAFEPDVIYTPLGFSRVLRLVRRIASRRRVPVVPHFMDDWVPNVLRGAGEAIPRRFVMRDLAWVMDRAPIGLAISPEMAVEYEAKYSKPFIPIGNFVDVGPPAAPPFGDRSVFGYVGGLHLDRATPLLDVARSIEALAGKARLEIVCPLKQAETERQRFGPFKWTTFRPVVEPSEVADLLRTYHALVHVESDEESSKRWVRLSLSTKIPQYLASGRPILAYGPLDVASMRHLDRSRGAALVQIGDDRALYESVSRLAINPIEREARGALGRSFAEANHERRTQTAVLAGALESAARMAIR